jgi:hypothetical protein
LYYYEVCVFLFYLFIFIFIFFAQEHDRALKAVVEGESAAGERAGQLERTVSTMEAELAHTVNTMKVELARKVSQLGAELETARQEVSKREALAAQLEATGEVNIVIVIQVCALVVLVGMTAGDRFLLAAQRGDQHRRSPFRVSF